MDVFNNDAFATTRLTDAINKRPFKPGLIGRLGLFVAKGIDTTTLWVEEEEGRLSLVQTSPRGAPGQTQGREQRNAYAFRAKHLQLNDAIYADEVQNVRRFGSERELETVESKVNERLGEMQDNIVVTLEYHRIGALKGLVLDADGTTLENLFTKFDVAQQTLAIDFGDDGSNPETEMRNQLVGAKRLAEDELGGLMIDGFVNLCGKDFWDNLVAHESVRRAYDTQQGQHLGQDLREVGFTWAGITHYEYRGSVAPIGSGTAVDFVEDDEAWLVPLCTPSIYVVRYAPADYVDAVNELPPAGLPFYARQAPDPSGFNKHRALEVQSNPITLNLRPRAVVKLTIAE